MSDTILLKNATTIDRFGTCRMKQNLYISDGKISAIKEADADDSTCSVNCEIDCTHYYVSPGIPNLHVHTAMNIFKGIAEDANADTWFNELIFPYESNLKDRDIYLGTRLGIDEMINNGVTVCADHYFGEEEVLKAAKESGMRYDLAPTLFGSTPDYKERLKGVLAFIDAHQNDSDRIAFRMGPHADYTCPPDTLMEMAQIAHEKKLPMHIHLTDDRAQIQLSQDRYGKTPCRVLEEAGLLNENIILAHGLWVDEDMPSYLTNSCWFASCPKTYMKMSLGVGTFFKIYKKLQFAYGTDGAASSNTLNPVEQARIFALIGKDMYTPEEFSVKEIWQHLMSGHDAFSFGTGHMEAGAPADLVIWDLDTPDTAPVYDPVASILYSSNSNNVRYTMVAGEFLKEEGRLKADYPAHAAEAKEAIIKLLERGKGKAVVTFLR